METKAATPGGIVLVEMSGESFDTEFGSAG